jgi:uncharacterized protein
MSNEIVVTGASGWLGAHTSRVLSRLGWDVVGVSDNPLAARAGRPRWRWIGTETELESTVERVGRVLDLGVQSREPTDGRAARAEVTRRVVRALSRSAVDDPVLIRAGGCCVDRDERELGEGPADLVAPRARVAIMRIGLVLGADGGVFPSMRRPFDEGHGVLLGSGRQWLPWIHLTDAVGLLVEAISDPAFVGSVNVVAPEAARYVDLARATGDVLGVPWETRVPEDQAVRMFGEASELLLHNHRLAPPTTLPCLFCFAHPDITSAVEDILHGPRHAGVLSSPHMSAPSRREIPCSVTTPDATG